MDFSKKVKSRRESLELTLKEIADIVGVSTPTISRYESGNIKNVRRDKIVQLSKALQCSPEYLMGWHDIKGLGSKIKTERESNKIEVSSIAQLLSTSIQQIENYENNSEDIDYFHFKSYCEVLHIDPYSFLVMNKYQDNKIIDLFDKKTDNQIDITSLNETEILTIAAHNVGYDEDLSNEDIEKIKLAIKIALSK